MNYRPHFHYMQTSRAHRDFFSAFLGRPRGDMWEVALWEDILTVNGDEAYYTYQVYNEAIVVPENIDAIRALTELASTAEASMRITDETMGIKKEFLLS